MAASSLPATPQPVVAKLTRAAIFLVVTIDPGAGPETAVRALCADLPALLRAVGFRDLEGRLSCVAAFGSAAWDRLFGAGPRPRELHPFPEIRGKHHAVSTPGDILFHIRAARSEWTSTNERSHVNSPWKGRETLLGNLSQNSCA